MSSVQVYIHGLPGTCAACLIALGDSRWAGGRNELLAVASAFNQQHLHQGQGMLYRYLDACAVHEFSLIMHVAAHSSATMHMLQTLLAPE
jgi:hypothetical protein